MAEDSRDRPRPPADVTSSRRLEKTAAPRSTRRSRPLASRASVWTMCLEGLLLYIGSFRLHFVRFAISSFVSDVCSPFHASLCHFRLLPSSIAAPFLTLFVYALNVAHLNNLVKFPASRTPLLIVYDAARPFACRQQYHLRVCLFTFSPSSSLMHVE